MQPLVTISMKRLLALLLLFTGITHAAEIPFTLDKPMRVSINVYDSKGAIVRSLLCGAPRQKGRQREFWGGRDRAGNPVPAGEYSWKVLAMPGRLKTEYLLTAATNYPDPVPDPMQETEHYPLVAPGTHGGPIAVTADESGVYIGAACTENIENYLIKLSPDVTRPLWSKMQRVPWKGGALKPFVTERITKGWAKLDPKPEEFTTFTGTIDVPAGSGLLAIAPTGMTDCWMTELRVE